jgi:hypothetical protein
MNTPTEYRTLLARAEAQAFADPNPDGMPVRQALLLATHAGSRRADGPGAVDWDFYSIAISRAVEDLQADLDDPAALLPGLPPPGPDSAELREIVAGLVRRLANLFATAAAGQAGSPWRRLVWAKVAHQLDEAIAELA